MITYYTSGNASINLIGPFVTAGVWINPKCKPLVDRIVKEYLYDYESSRSRIRDLHMRRMFTTLGALNRMYDIHTKNKAIPPFVVVYKNIQAWELNTTGIGLCIDKSIKSCVVEMKARLINLNIDSSEPFIYTSGDDNLRNLHGLLTYLYANMHRYAWLKLYNYHYWKLKLILNWGSISEHHMRVLYDMKVLPPFYLWLKTMRAMNKFCEKKEINLPEWYNKEMNAYEHISQYDDATYALCL